MSSRLAIVATVHLVFLVYLLLARVTPRQVGRIWLFALGYGVVIMGVPLIASLQFMGNEGYGTWFLSMLLGTTMLALPWTAAREASQSVLVHTSLVQVVIINAAALAIGELPAQVPGPWSVNPAGWVEWLLNPFRSLIDADGVARYLIGLWPSYLALLLAMRGPPGDPRLRLLLVLWTDLVAVLWLLPLALHSVWSFDASGIVSYLTSVFACLGAVHVVLLAVNLLGAMFPGESEHDRKPDLTQRLASSLVLNHWPWWILVLAGVGAHVAAAVLYAYTQDLALTLTVAYLTATLLGGLGARTARSGADKTGLPAVPAAEPNDSGWRPRRSRLLDGVVGIGLVWLFDPLRWKSVIVAGEDYVLTLLAIVMRVLGAALILSVLLSLLWIVVETLGQRIRRAVRVLVLLAGVALIGAWQWNVRPVPHPAGGLDQSEVSFNGQRIYIWHAHEAGPASGTGRLLYVEQVEERGERPGANRGWRWKLKACGLGPQGPVQSFHIEKGVIVCQWPGTAMRVNVLGEP